MFVILNNCKSLQLFFKTKNSQSRHSTVPEIANYLSSHQRWHFELSQSSSLFLNFEERLSSKDHLWWELKDIFSCFGAVLCLLWGFWFMLLCDSAPTVHWAFSLLDVHPWTVFYSIIIQTNTFSLFVLTRILRPDLPNRANKSSFGTHEQKIVLFYLCLFIYLFIGQRMGMFTK